MEKILEKKLPRRCGSAAKEILTVFQFWSYLEAEGVSELETHVTELAEEGRFLYVCFLPNWFICLICLLPYFAAINWPFENSLAILNTDTFHSHALIITSFAFCLVLFTVPFSL